VTPLRRGLPVPATAAVRATADKHFRRPDMRPNRRRRWTLTWRRAALLAVAGLGLIGAAGWLAHRVIGSSALAVRSVVVRGNSRLSTPDVEAIVGDIRGESILRVDLDRYRQRLLDAPWVSSATLWRVLPSTVGIQIVERTPMVIARQEELLYLVDDTGTIIDEFGPRYRAFDLPVVDGLLPAAAAAGGTVDAARLKVTAQFLDAIGAAPEFRSRVSQVDVTDAHDVVAILGTDPAMLHLGDREFVERLRRYVEMAPQLRDQFKAIDAVDLRFDERVFVRKGR
jgi:cell division septal protein FtsQ